MAGRGVDIVLGGNPNAIFLDLCRKKGVDPQAAAPEDLEAINREAQDQWRKDHDLVVSLGGLHIIGTERHEARRIDNQLRRMFETINNESICFYVAFLTRSSAGAYSL